MSATVWERRKCGWVRESIHRVKGHCPWLQRPLETLDVLAAITMFTSVQIRNQEASGEQPINIINIIKDNALTPSDTLHLSLSTFLFSISLCILNPHQLSASLSLSLINIWVLSHGPTSLCLADKLALSWTKIHTEKPRLGQWLSKNNTGLNKCLQFTKHTAEWRRFYPWKKKKQWISLDLYRGW